MSASFALPAGRGAAFGGLAVAALLAAGPTSAQPVDAGIPVAPASYVEKGVEVRNPGAGWHSLTEGERIRTGDELRTGSDAVARLAFPWMTITASPSALISIPNETVLSMVLQQGRVEVLSEGADMIKIVSGKAEVRGRGHAVLRRRAGTTLASCLEGTLRVKARGRVVSLAAGEGTQVEDGGAPAPPERLPPPPTSVTPGKDPLYVRRGDRVRVSWTPSGPTQHIQVLPLQGPDVLIERDVGASPEELEVPWLGTFRFRVASIAPNGLEGPASQPGLLCIVEK